MKTTLFDLVLWIAIGVLLVGGLTLVGCRTCEEWRDLKEFELKR